MLRGMWDLPRPGTKPLLPALAGGPFTSEPPGTPRGLSKLVVMTYTGLPRGLSGKESTSQTGDAGSNSG